MTRPASYCFFLYIQFSFTAQCSEDSEANFTNISNFNLNFFKGPLYCIKYIVLCGTGSIIYKLEVQKTILLDFWNYFQNFTEYHTVLDGTEKETFNMHLNFVLSAFSIANIQLCS